MWSNRLYLCQLFLFVIFFPCYFMSLTDFSVFLPNFNILSWCILSTLFSISSSILIILLLFTQSSNVTSIAYSFSFSYDVYSYFVHSFNPLLYLSAIPSYRSAIAVYSRVLRFSSLPALSADRRAHNRLQCIRQTHVFPPPPPNGADKISRLANDPPLVTSYTASGRILFVRLTFSSSPRKKSDSQRDTSASS